MLIVSFLYRYLMIQFANAWSRFLIKKFSIQNVCMKIWLFYGLNPIKYINAGKDKFISNDFFLIFIFSKMHFFANLSNDDVVHAHMRNYCHFHSPLFSIVDLGLVRKWHSFHTCNEMYYYQPHNLILSWKYFCSPVASKARHSNIFKFFVSSRGLDHQSINYWWIWSNSIN